MSGTGRRRGSFIKDKHRKKPDAPKGNSPLDRTLYITVNLIGQQVEVQISDGSWYEGLLHTVSTNKGFGVVLKCARKKTNESNNEASFIDKINIPPSDFVQIVAADVVFVEDTSDSAGSGFLTDTAISRSGEMKERELQPWKPDESVPAPSLTGTTQDWDQFRENERLFGVKTSYNEEIYTTSIDKNSQFYRQRESEAARLAQEISSETTNFVQVAVERGFAVEVDEEDLYGSVERKPAGTTAASTTKFSPSATTTTATITTTAVTSTGGAQKYVPPARRALMGQQSSGESSAEPTPSSTKVAATTSSQQTPSSPVTSTVSAPSPTPVPTPAPISSVTTITTETQTSPEKDVLPVETPQVSQPVTQSSSSTSEDTSVGSSDKSAETKPAKSTFVFRRNQGPVTINTNQHLNELYCSSMNRVGWTDPLTVSPFWGTKGSWKFTEDQPVPFPYQFPPVPFPVMYPSIPVFQPAPFFPPAYPVPQKHFYPPGAKLPPAPGPYGAPPMYSTFDVEYPYTSESRFE